MFHKINISDYYLRLSKIQKQFQNCEPVVVNMVRKGLIEYIELFRKEWEDMISQYIISFQEFFKKADIYNHSTWIPIPNAKKHSPANYLYVLIQDLYVIGRVFRTKWGKPHEPSMDHILYTGSAHTYTVYMLLRYVPGIKLRASSSGDMKTEGGDTVNCSTVKRYRSHPYL